MKRDAQLTLRVPASLKEEIQRQAAKENRKPADKAVRTLEASGELYAAAKDTLEFVPCGEKKDRLVLALLRMGLMAIFLVWHVPAFAISPDQCVAMCKIMNRSKGGVTCSIYYVEGAGGFLFLDFKTKRTQDVSPETTLQWEGLRDAFVSTGGFVEMSDPSGKSINFCFSPSRRASSDMQCQATEPKDSHRFEIHNTGSRFIAGAKL